jgi:hypothetical protein
MFYGKLKIIVSKCDWVKSKDATLLELVKLRNSEERRGKPKDEREVEEEKHDHYWQVNIIELGLISL